ncbi:unnamed protein product [Coccothraustes coccothraustes]
MQTWKFPELDTQHFAGQQIAGIRRAALPSPPCGRSCGAPLAVGRSASQGAARRSPAGKMCRAAWRQGAETLVSHAEGFFPFSHEVKGKGGSYSSPCAEKGREGSEGAGRPLLAPVASGSGAARAGAACAAALGTAGLDKAFHVSRIPGEGSGHESSAL